MYESPASHPDATAAPAPGAEAAAPAHATPAAGASAETAAHIKPIGRVARALLALAGLVSAGAGLVGVVVPVLPTTPFLLLAAFLFARSSNRLARWLESTKAYRSYVVPFRDKRGMNAGTKVRILVISYVAMGASAFLVRDVSVAWAAWACLGCAGAWLAWFVCIRTPTLRTTPAPPHNPAGAED